MFRTITSLWTRALAAFLLAAAAAAQLPKPVNPPPWWGVADNDTVSIYWSFDNPQAPLAHHPQSVVPAWYTFPANDGFTQRSGPSVQWLANVSGHAGVLGFTGTGSSLSALLNLQIDNDPRVNWIKVFYFQFESTSTASGKATALIEENLSQYRRMSTTENTVAIGSGWVRTTITAELLPQPAYEAVEFTLTESALASVGIDNLFVNSKCVKPWNDEDGDALGVLDATQPALDLQNSTGNAQCEAAACSEDAQGVRTYWVSGSGNAQGLQHQLYPISSSGQLAGTPIVVGSYSTSTPLGLTALSYEPTGFNQGIVHGIRDLRLANGTIEIVSVQTATSVVTTRSLQTQGLSLPSAPHRFGLAFYPPGDSGAGSFWITDNQDVAGAASSAYEFSRTGALLNPNSTTNNNLVGQLPPRTVGMGYDPLKGMLYFASADALTTPLGTVRTNTIEVSAYDLRPTGVQFFGDLQRSDPNGPGGAVKSLQVYRRLSGEWRALQCVTTAGRTVLYEQKGPYRFGLNQLGRIGMRGLPMRGSTSFQVNLNGIPRATGAILYAGFNNVRNGSVPLPYSLAQFGLLESNISVSLDMNSVFLPVINGTCSTTIPLLPPGASPPNVPLFFQWVVFDPTVRNGVATSQAGKVLIY